MAGSRKLMLVTTELEVGGAERCLVNLACGLKQQGFAPTVVALAGPPHRTNDALVRALRESQIDTHFLGLTRRRQFRTAVRQLSTLVRQQQPALLQSFLFHADMVASCAARRCAGPPVVLGIRVAEPTRWRQWLERLAARHAAKTICVSQSVADACRRWGIDQQQLVVIPNGLDVERFDAARAVPRADLKVPSDDRLIVFVGRLEPQKGLDWLLERMPGILQQVPGSRLLVIGDGGQRETLENQARRLKVGHRTSFLGWRADAAGILKTADLVVLPSRWEGMPNVLLEAMAAERAVAAVQVEGVAEVLGPAVDDQAVPAEDPKGFTSLVAELLENRQRAEQLGRSNRERLVAKFSLPRMVDRYAAVYQTILQ